MHSTIQWPNIAAATQEKRVSPAEFSYFIRGLHELYNGVNKTVVPDKFVKSFQKAAINYKIQLKFSRCYVHATLNIEIPAMPLVGFVDLAYATVLISSTVQ